MSGCVRAHDQIHTCRENPPFDPLTVQGLIPVFREGVVASAAVAVDPIPRDPPSFLHSVEDGIDGRPAEGQEALGSGLDPSRDLVPVQLPILQE